MTQTFDLDQYPVASALPEHLAPSEWIELTPLGMLLVALLQPRLLVELGTHYGVSYCAFCQAVAALKLTTACRAVDTWVGDAHSAYYGPDVLRELRAYHDPKYGHFSRLLPETFEAARSHFAPGAIDLLHIDGVHTEQAVRGDFAAWLPYMSSRGVMLFHDISARHAGFGVHRFWQTMRQRFPHFEVAYGHGLGILAVGPEIPPGLQLLLDLIPGEKQEVEEQLYNLGRRAAAAQRAALPVTRALPWSRQAAPGSQAKPTVTRPDDRKPQALIVNAGINHFFDLEGLRVAEALTALGIAVTVTTLDSIPAAGFDWCFVNNPLEAAVSSGNIASGVERLAALTKTCGRVYGIAMEDVSSRWLPPILDVTARARIETLLDLGLQPQPPAQHAGRPVPLRFVFNGLTRGEKSGLQTVAAAPQPRPIPWAMVGIQTPHRVHLAEMLVRYVAPDGFLYLPQQGHGDTERRHLGQAEMMHVLRHTEYAIWCSQHNPRYMESQRFRQAILAGAAPVKVLPGMETPDPSTPFAYALIGMEMLEQQSVLMPARILHRRTADDFCAMPCLEAGLADLLGLPLPEDEDHV